MSYYDDDRPRRQTSTRDRDYDRTTSYKASRGGGGRQTSLVRRDDSDSADEEVTRDFPPGGGYYRETTVRKSGRGPPKSRGYSDDRRDERSYTDSRRSDDYSSRKSKNQYDDRRSDRRSRRYSSESSDSHSRPRKERRKSTGEDLLASLGLGGLVGGLLGKKDGSRSPSRSRGGGARRGRSEDRSRSRGAKGRSKSVGREQLIQAIKAAALAGAGEAFRVRKEPGGWNGDKGKRILTAAVAAAGVDGLISSKKDPDQHGKRDVIGSAIAGLAANRLVNGARSKSRGPGGSPDRRGRSGSRGGGLGDLAAGGVLAAAGKKAYDSFRGRSKSRGRSRSLSSGSYDSRSPPRNKRRSKSVSGYAARGFAAVGAHDLADKIDPPRQRGGRYDDNYYDDRSGHGGPPGYGAAGAGGPPGNGYNGYQNNNDVGSSPRDTSRAGGQVVGPPGHEYSLDYQPHHTGDAETDSDSDLGSSSGDEKERKKSRRKLLISSGLATIATIHAGHSIYQTMEKRDHNRKALKEGDISKEEAKKRKNKMRFQEAAAVGIAGLGLKGAYSEWNEMKESREEHYEYKEKVERHAEKRAARRQKYEEERRLYQNSGYTASMPDLRTSGNGFPPPPGGAPNSAAPRAHYFDDNPYASYNSPQYNATQQHDPNGPPPAGAPPPHAAYL